MTLLTGTTMYKTEQEIIDEIYANLDKNSRKLISSILREEMVQFHFRNGMAIRNAYKFWDRENPLVHQWFLDEESNSNKYIRDGVDYHPQHPDAVSMNILYKIWDKVNG